MTRARRIRVRAAVLIGLCFMAAQCGDNTPTTPSEFLSGVWTGMLQDSISGPATALVTITQVGDSLVGTWSVDATSFAGANGGSLFGTVTWVQRLDPAEAERPARLFVQRRGHGHRERDGWHLYHVRLHGRAERQHLPHPHDDRIRRQPIVGRRDRRSAGRMQPDFHHGLLGSCERRYNVDTRRQRASGSEGSRSCRPI